MEARTHSALRHISTSQARCALRVRPRLRAGDINRSIHACAGAPGSSVNLASFLAPEGFRPRRSLLTSEEQEVYAVILRGFLNFERAVKIPAIGADRIERIFWMIHDDFPEIFWVDSGHLRGRAATDTMTLAIDYWMGKAAALSILKRMQRCAERLQRMVRGKSELQRQCAIHDFLVTNVSPGDAPAHWAHEACGPLVDGRGVCDGLARAYKYLADRCGVRTMVVRGISSSEAMMHEGLPLDDSDASSVGGHAWNVTRLGDVWYHQDIMYDTCVTSVVPRYDYFGLSDEEISLDHRLDAPLCAPSEYPKCPRPLGYYRLAARYVTTQQQLKSLLAADMARRAPSVFQLPAASTKDLEATRDMIFRVAEEAAGCKSVRSQQIDLAVDSARAVYQVTLG